MIFFMITPFPRRYMHETPNATPILGGTIGFALGNLSQSIPCKNIKMPIVIHLYHTKIIFSFQPKIQKTMKIF